jgi:hypothetical protein
MKNIFILCLFAASMTVQAQIPKINLDEPYLKSIKKHEVAIIGTSLLYVNDGESKSLFYYALVPNEQIKGYLLYYLLLGIGRRCD